jgi:glutamyl-tRNA synthetase
MRTTHVIRGEEWLPSLAKHMMLFRYLGFKLPKYMHIAQIMRLDENGNKKKLSKRDMGANMDDYSRMGYNATCVCEYIMTLLNSNYEEWHMQNPDKPYTDFPFNIKKMSCSGCLFDFNKLNDVSKNIISRMTAEEVYAFVSEWASLFDPDFAKLITADPAYTTAIFAIGRGGKKPRKDFATWADTKDYVSFFFDESFTIAEPYADSYDRADIKAALTAFLASYDAQDDMTAWFDKIKAVAESIGYASDMKLYKANPEAFKGNVADVSMFLRVAVTGKLNSPDMYAVMQVLGEDRVRARVQSMIDSL